MSRSETASEASPAPEFHAPAHSGSPWVALAVAAALTGLALGPLLAGFEPIGGDPDRFYRPIKGELAKALSEGRLPFWSDQFGIGAPLLAESHAAALYPPNWLLYRTLDPSLAYRLAMWGHYVALAAFTFLYARVLGLTSRGAALAAVAFALCGFQAIHSSHEWAYHGLAYLPLVLWIVERYAATGRIAWLAGLALAWGAQCTLGHFQVAFWTGVLAAGLGAWRILAGRRGFVRLAGLGIGLAGGLLLAAPQLGPTWELARFVARDRRPFAYLAYHTLPPAHWAELAAPRLFRDPTGDPESGYWAAQGTSGYEAALYVGTVPLILALVALVGGRVRGPLRVWVPIIGVGFALATMARWWPAGYAAVLAVPGFGLFRCPARYTALVSLGLALLAGAGLDGAIRGRRFAAGLAVAVLFGLGAVGWSVGWLMHWAPAGRVTMDALWPPLAWTGLAWAGALAAVVLGRTRRLAWAPVLVTAVELTALYYHSTTTWGRPVRLPDQSPALQALLREPGVGLVTGPVENLPVLAGLATGTPYLGFPLPSPNPVLLSAQGRPVDSGGLRLNRVQAALWLRRLGVTHGLWPGAVPMESGTPLWTGDDPGLDRLAYRAPGETGPRRWTLARLPDPLPEIRVALKAAVLPELNAVVERLSTVESRETVLYLPVDLPPGASSQRASQATVTSWGGTTAVVEHDGTCDLVLRRPWYPGWTVRINDGPAQAVGRADGWFQAVRLDGRGPSQVRFAFEPTGWQRWQAIALTTLAVALATLGFRWPKIAPAAGSPDGDSRTN